MRSEEYGVLQQLVDKLYEHKKVARNLDLVLLAEIHDVSSDLREIISLLPPGTYHRQALCDQLNSSISGHGWGMKYGTVE